MKAPPLHAANGDVRIAYEVRGSGEPLLLIHGLGYGRWGWQPVADPLADEFRVVMYDNRGLGESEVPPGPYTVRQLTADAVAVLDAAGVERAHVVGTSLGGMVAQELAISFPERVERLVLACTTPGGPASHPMPQQTIDLLLEAAQLPVDVAIRRFVANALAPGAAEARPELVERIVELRLASPLDPGGWRAQAAAGAAFDALDRLDRIEAPTMVVTGTDDTVVDWRNSQLLVDRIPGARLEVFPGTGHLFFWEEPGRFVELVREFLA